MSIYLRCALPRILSSLPGSRRCEQQRGACRHRSPCLTLLRMGFTEPCRSPDTLVSSYLTVSPLPSRRTGIRRSVFCGTFPGLATGRRYRPSCSAEPGLSSRCQWQPANIQSTRAMNYGPTHRVWTDSVVDNRQGTQTFRSARTNTDDTSPPAPAWEWTPADDRWFGPDIQSLPKKNTPGDLSTIRPPAARGGLDCPGGGQFALFVALLISQSCIDGNDRQSLKRGGAVVTGWRKVDCLDDQ